jgi:hypothetical protein
MNLAVPIENFDLNIVYYLEPIRNTVIDNSYFIRVLYSNGLFILNGIYLVINFNNIYIDHHTYNNKMKYSFVPETNIDILNTIKNIEGNLLKKVNIKNKNLSTKISDQLNSGFIKICIERNDVLTNKFILKISGVWESEEEYGLTYKFLNIINNFGINNIGINNNYPSVE